MISDFEIVKGKGGLVTVHKRNIDETSSWASRVINGVRLDDSSFWNLQLAQIKSIRETTASSFKEVTPTFINYQDTPTSIMISENSHKEEKGEGKFYRKRKIRRSGKNFPTKPKGSVKRDKQITLEKEGLGFYDVHLKEQNN